MDINPQYNVARPDSLPVRVASYQRRKMFDAFLAGSRPSDSDSILDVGVTSDRSYDHSNYLEAWYPHRSRVVAAGIDDAGFLAELYPGVTVLRADGLHLPFKPGSFDLVHSSAVLEHVGSGDRQTEFVSELWRVARRGIFLTTPNRWFPIEFHTILPLVHWLPRPAFEKVLMALGKDFFAREENLNLLSRRSLARIAVRAGIRRFRVDSVSLFGWPTNLLLIGEK
jgi:hypothetical protein